jgi:hypothetical protein
MKFECEFGRNTLRLRLRVSTAPRGEGNDSPMKGIQFIAGTIAIVAGAANAEAPPPICADRPGKATSACTVPKGHWQMETGIADWSLQNEDGERDTSLVVGETTIKYGLIDSADIEVDVTSWQRATSHAGTIHDSASGFGDINFIYKQRLTASASPVQIIAMPLIKAPTAKSSLGNGKWEGGILFPIGYSIPKSPFSIGLTPEVDWVADADGHGHHGAMAQVVTLGWQANPKLNLSAELWGQWDWDPAGTTRQASADGSVAYLLTNDVQLDAGANFGLNEQTPDVELYGGISVRF